MHRSRHRSDPPPGWTVLCEGFLEAPASVSRRLWSAFEEECSLGERYVLENCLQEGYAAPPEQVLRMITPRRMLRLTVAVAPEIGRPRDRQIVALEERSLAAMRGPARRQPWYA